MEVRGMSTLIFDNHTSLARDRFLPAAKMLRRENCWLDGKQCRLAILFNQWILLLNNEEIVIDGWPKTTTLIEQCFFAAHRLDKMKVEARDCSPPTFRCGTECMESDSYGRLFINFHLILQLLRVWRMCEEICIDFVRCDLLWVSVPPTSPPT